MKKTLTTAAAALAMSLPAAADPAIGFGISFAFGGGSSGQSGVGVRLFTDDTKENFVGSVGVDYMFKSKSVRPTVGVAYLGSNAYVGADLGFDLGGGGLDFGLSTGFTDTNAAAGGGGGGGGGGGSDSGTGGSGDGNDVLEPV